MVGKGEPFEFVPVQSALERPPHPRMTEPMRAVLENKKLQPSAGSMEECEPSVAAGYPSQQTNGGLTICQAGKVIFRLPPPKVLPVRTSRAPSLSSEAGPARR